MVTELGRISRISTRRAYVVADIEGHELVHETRDAGFYDPPPAIGDTLIRLADGTLSHRPARSATHNDDMPICGPAALNDSLDRLAQTLAEREREW
ncbi:hypothetical protein [Azospirillum sp. TSO5]|uniref:hypothetical protein n=1 Tax=Azospirillum sp. TSO5 TaxID=716760 RepID=UPI000D612ABC|nr:hypothetical protein [Azospirillum sp. TSO5]PWC96950.1 hypothetical protein TSO5_05830 [Azospirillum sp. TSO5]